MEITKSINPMSKEESYHIALESNDKIEPYDLAESFTHQYPKTKAVLTYSKIIQMELGLLILGLNLKRMKNEKGIQS